MRNGYDDDDGPRRGYTDREPPRRKDNVRDYARENDAPRRSHRYDDDDHTDRGYRPPSGRDRDRDRDRERSVDFTSKAGLQCFCDIPQAQVMAQYDRALALLDFLRVVVWYTILLFSVSERTQWLIHEFTTLHSCSFGCLKEMKHEANMFGSNYIGTEAGDIRQETIVKNTAATDQEAGIGIGNATDREKSGVIRHAEEIGMVRNEVQTAHEETAKAALLQATERTRTTSTI